MIQKLICLIWGHRIREKAFTGNRMDARSYAGIDMKISLFKWKYNDKCPRCNKEVNLYPNA